MCGIIAILRRRSGRQPPSRVELVDHLDAAWSAAQADPHDLVSAFAAAADHLEQVDRLLRGAPGARTLVSEPDLADLIRERVVAFEARLAVVEDALDGGHLRLYGADLEAANAALVRMKDASYALGNDRVRTARALADFGVGPWSRPAIVEGYAAIHSALSGLDRLEVRGRDSAGLHLFVENHGLSGGDVATMLRDRRDPLFTSGAVEVAGDVVSFVYKAAAEIGELGDNTARLRAEIAGDDLLRRALDAPDAVVSILGHTRWASVGIISEPNAHPVASSGASSDSTEATEATDAAQTADLPYVVAALNGDVDNHVELKSRYRLAIPAEVTTDAKIIPVLVARNARDGASGEPVHEAFRRAVADFEGSVAVAAAAASAPGQVMLALRGSGQALYAGIAEDSFVVASEPYGLIEETSRYLRMDGEGASGRDGSAGQIVVLDRHRAGSLDGLQWLAYDGTDLPVGDDDLSTAAITTRDVDRRGHPHYLVKEINQAPQSMRKTLRGKIADDGAGRLTVTLPSSSLPTRLQERLKAGEIRRIYAIGQGTAAVAAQAVAASFTAALGPTDIRVEALPATELSGFRMDDDMSDVLVVAISQSGTTTDTNRTVDLVRSRGAAVVAVVNRRNSDLVEKSDGVLYTSDGRDVEMAVPSTKAFYVQVAAGVLLAWAVADAAGVADAERRHGWLEALGRLPAALEDVLARRADIAVAAHRYGPPRRYWALVGNGANRVAAAELRIKLSELCYKSIACDVTEDKKHIDLSAEPMILVCAAGLSGANADDVAKEVAIFRAHKAAPIVIAGEGEGRFAAAVHVLEVPRVHPELDFVLAAMAGHLFGYEAALAIDGQARLLREARAVVEDVVAAEGEPEGLLVELGPALTPAAGRFFEALRSDGLNGHLEASTAVRLASLFRFATGGQPIEAYELEYGKVGSPAAIVDDLVDALTRAIDELTRPIDAIKHQAKTVTVGISRAEDTYAEVTLVRETIAAGAARDRLSYRSRRALAALDAAVDKVTGYTRYTVEGDPAAGTATIGVIDKGGVVADVPSRTETDPRLKGTKRRAATEREVTVTRGERDGRTIVIVPEVKDNQVTELTLLHVDFHDRLAPDVFRAVLSGYRNRYNALVDAVCETEPSFDDSRLAEVAVADVLVEPVRDLARLWRAERG